jgi:hypothetical protein
MSHAYVRNLSARLVEHAASIMGPPRSDWGTAMAHELQHLDSDRQALLWALGCVWSAYVERYSGRALSALLTGGVLLVLLSNVARLALLAFWGWYGAFLHGFAVGLLVLCLVGIATRGRWQTRLLATIFFPVFSFLTFVTLAFCSQLAQLSTPWLSYRHHGRIPALWVDSAIAVSGFLQGTLTALLIVVPFVLIYRSRAAVIALLALLPAVCLQLTAVTQTASSAHALLVMSMGLAWSTACAVVTLLWCASSINRWLPPTGVSCARA